MKQLTVRVCIIGGDQRQIQVMRQLAHRSAIVHAVGFESVNDPFLSGVIHTSLNHVPFHLLDAIILPVQGTDDSGIIKSVYAQSTFRLTAGMLERTPSHCVIFSGIVTSYLHVLSQKIGRKLIPIFQFDDVAIRNSIPTAEGVLMKAIQETDITLHSAHVVILGFGRIGLTIVRLFSAIHAKVEVGVKNSAQAARAEEMGLEFFDTAAIKEHVGSIDICINTVPHLILTADVLEKMSKCTLIIDVASNPGGTDFDFAKKIGIRALHLLGLPGKTAPKTAGQIIANKLIELLEQGR